MTAIQISGTVFGPAAPGYDVVRLPRAAPALLEAGDAAWEAAAVVQWGRDPYPTRFRACWDALALHVRFDAVDASPWHTMTTRDDHIWEEEVVEIFIDADGSGLNYAELEINPVNVVCDLRVATPWPSLKSFTEWDWDGLATSVAPLGDVGATGWVATARLPWAGLRSLYPSGAVGLPPRPGQAWRFNVFRIKRPGGPLRPADGAVLAAWSRPAGPSFHDPAAFRPMTFL